MAFCVNCGTEIAEGIKFCPSCGQPTSSEASNTTENVNEYKPTYGNEQKVKEKRPVPVCGIIALILAILGFFSYASIFSVIMCIAALVLSIVSFVRHEKLIGLGIIAIIILVISLAVFAMSASGTSSPASSSDKSNVSSNVSREKTETVPGVDPDLVAFLTEYETFMDDYIDFMAKYYENPTDLSLLADYADMLQKYESFATQVDAYDSSDMSTADAAYYLEVTSRVTQKMLNVLGSYE